MKMQLLVFNAMNSENNPRWQEVSEKIQREKLELEREIERLTSFRRQG